MTPLKFIQFIQGKFFISLLYAVICNEVILVRNNWQRAVEL